MSKQNKQVLTVGTVLFAALAIALLALPFFGGARGEAGLRNFYLEMLSSSPTGYSENTLSVLDCDYDLAANIARSLGGELRMDQDLRYGKILLPVGLSSERAIQSIEDKYLAYLAPDALVYADSLNEQYNDPLSAFEDSLSYSLMNAGDAQKITAGSHNGKKVKIAVIDSGIDYTHEEFSGRISEESYNVSLGKSVKEAGGDFSILKVSGTSHGTSVAGVIAASANNGKGIVGIAYDCELVVIKLSVSEKGAFNSADMMAGVEYAVSIGCDVVNLSMGGYSPIPGCDTVFKNAIDKGTVIVCASGNESKCEPHYPSSSRYAISVGALSAYTNASEKNYQGIRLIASYSNYGNNLIMAPGTWLTTSDSLFNATADRTAMRTYGGWYNIASGTSLACPAVSASIGLYKSLYPDAGWQQIKDALCFTATDLGDEGYDRYYGYGLIDLSAFLSNNTVQIRFQTGISDQNIIMNVIKGSSLNSCPSLTNLNGKIFEGWYLDSKYQLKVNPYTYSFSSDATVYAKWIDEEDALPWDFRKSDPVLTITRILEKVGDKNSFTVRSLTASKIYSKFPDVSAYPDLYSEIYKIISGCEGETVAKLATAAVCSGAEQYSVYAYRGTREDITLPSSYLGHTVVSISPKAFASSKIRSVTIPDTVWHIGFSAFSGCPNLIYLQIPKSVIIIEENAFEGSKTDVYTELSKAPLGWTRSRYIFGDTSDSYTHEWYGGGGDVLYSSTRKQIGDYQIILNKSSGTNIQVLKYLGQNATVDFKELGSFDYLEIASSAFEDSQIESIYIPSSISKIGDFAFKNCAKLRNIVFENGSEPKYIGKGAFWGCSALERMEYPVSLTAIPENIFKNCTSLIEINFRKNSQLTSIENDAFDNCASLSRLSFLECTELQTVSPAFKGCNSLIYLAFPDSVTSFSSGALQNLKALSWLQLPFVGRTATENNTLGYLFGSADPQKKYGIPSTLNTLIVTKKMSSTDNTFAGLPQGCEVWSSTVAVNLPQGVIGHFADDWQLIKVHYQKDYYVSLPYVVGFTPESTKMPLPGGKSFAGLDSDGDGIADFPLNTASSMDLLIQDCTYTVLYTDRHGKTVKSFENCAFGDEIIEPEVESSYTEGETSYFFVGWSRDVRVAYSDLIITPIYQQGAIQYTVQIIDSETGEFRTFQVKQGEIIPPLPSYTENGLVYHFIFDGETQEPLATGDAILSGHYIATPAKYTVLFVYEDYTVISEKEYEFGEKTEVPSDPTMPAGNKYVYTFSGWNRPISDTVTANAVYIAKFTSSVRYYTVTFKDYDGSIISSEKYQYGEILIPPSDPVRSDTDYMQYSFTGWNAQLPGKVFTDAEYMAEYSEFQKTFTIRFLDRTGNVLSERDYYFSETPEIPAIVEKELTERKEYLFLSWDKEVVTVSGNETYRPVYQEKDRLYTVEFIDEKGSVLSSQLCKYGEVPSLPDDVESSQLTGSLKAVTENTRYTVRLKENTPTEQKDRNGSGIWIAVFAGVVAVLAVPAVLLIKKHKKH